MAADLGAHLVARRDSGAKLLVPYVTGGMDGLAVVAEAVAAAGADAIEIGLPFSDPMIDGPVIQEASRRALAAGATPGGVLAEIGKLDAGVPLVVMTYYNLVLRAGAERFAAWCAGAGVSGVIVPDLPLEEVGPWAAAADAAGIATVLLAAPSTSDARLPLICARSRGFVYGVGVMGVTGERDALAASAIEVARRLKGVTDLPVLVGIGVSTPGQAAEVCTVADGVIVGSALVRRMLEGAGAEGAAAFVRELREGINAAAGKK